MQDIINHITTAEDAARQLRNQLAGRDRRDATAGELRRLADNVAHGFQAVREAIEELRRAPGMRR